MIGSTSTSIASTSSARESLAPPQIEQRVERRVRAGARRIQLHGDAGVDDLPARAEIGGDVVERRVARCPSRPEIPAARRSPRARGHAAPREQRREHAVARGQARVQRLHHRAEVLFQAGRFRRRDRQRVARSRSASSPSSRARRGRGADRAERRRAVPAALVVSRVHRAAEPRFDLEADDVGVEQRRRPSAPATSAAASAAGDERRARMRERHEAHVVVVERVRGGAVGERGVGRRTRAAAVPKTQRSARRLRPPTDRWTMRAAGSTAPASVTPTVSSTRARGARSRVGWRHRRRRRTAARRSASRRHSRPPAVADSARQSPP